MKYGASRAASCAGFGNGKRRRASCFAPPPHAGKNSLKHHALHERSSTRRARLAPLTSRAPLASRPHGIIPFVKDPPPERRVPRVGPPSAHWIRHCAPRFGSTPRCSAFPPLGRPSPRALLRSLSLGVRARERPRISDARGRDFPAVCPHARSHKPLHRA
jgi:hypothetical protein